MVVCHCHALNDSALRAHISADSATVDAIGARCRAGTRCGGCRPAIERLITQVVGASPDAG